jgi:hypothetical protein
MPLPALARWLPYLAALQHTMDHGEIVAPQRHTLPKPR